MPTRTLVTEIVSQSTDVNSQSKDNSEYEIQISRSPSTFCQGSQQVSQLASVDLNEKELRR